MAAYTVCTEGEARRAAYSREGWVKRTEEEEGRSGAAAAVAAAAVLLLVLLLLASFVEGDWNSPPAVAVLLHCAAAYVVAEAIVVSVASSSGGGGTAGAGASAGAGAAAAAVLLLLLLLLYRCPPSDGTEKYLSAVTSRKRRQARGRLQTAHHSRRNKLKVLTLSLWWARGNGRSMFEVSLACVCVVWPLFGGTVNGT